MKQSTDIKTDYRYELKYVIDPRYAYELESKLYSHPLCFSKVYTSRYINNIYFDDPYYTSCHDNLAGISDRTKIRYRWYGEQLHSNSGKVEFKIKRNELGGKKYIEGIKYHTLSQLSNDVNDSIGAKDYYIPTIRNQYLRNYYLDITGQYRLTIDTQIAYYLPIEGSHAIPQHRDKRIIVEIKFDIDKSEALDAVSHYFPFRRTKHSKYVTGLFALYG